MKTVPSKDGTAIAFECMGRGPPLILIGGALADHRFYAPLAAELAPHFTVLNYDRRGRGHSGDTQPYHVDREIEDLEALLAYCAPPAFVYGHSSGAALALRAAAAGLPIRRLVLAEPPFTPRGENDEKASGDFAEETAHVDALRRRGDARGSAKFFLGSMGVSDDDIEDLLNSPAGAGFIDCARALRYEYAILGDGLVPTSRAARVAMPTLILSGDAMQEAAAQLTRAMPNARVENTGVSMHEMSPIDTASRLKTAFLDE